MAFFLALLAALCAENIPLALGLTGAAGLTLTTSQTPKRLGIWAKKRAASSAVNTESGKVENPCSEFIHPYFKGSEGEKQV